MDYHDRIKRLEEKPKVSPKDDMSAWIKGLEQKKTEEGLSRADIAALDRAIEKWKRMQTNSVAPAAETKE